MVVGKTTIDWTEFHKRLREFGVSEKEASELGFHLGDLDIFFNGFKPHINKIIKCNKTDKAKFKELLEDLWGEFEHHIVQNHIEPAKEILNDITNRL